MAAIRTREGRNTIAGGEFRIFTSDGVRSFTPQTKEEYAEALRNYFGIVLEDGRSGTDFWRSVITG
jgi:N-hydroxyarylamine O-acetyltransferase